MNTLKKIVAFVLMTTLLVCVAFAFASCNAGKKDDGEVTHCPEDCECREEEAPSTPAHCPEDCSCRVEDNTPVNLTYLVVVRDNRGNIVPGVTVRVTDGNGYSDKVTDANGYLTFPLIQGTWTAQIVEAPLGYTFDPATKFEFDAQGVCAIELVKPVGYTFVAKSAYDDSVYADVIVELFAWDETIGDYNLETAVADGATDAEGKVTLEAVAGKYYVSFTIEGEKYIDYIEIDVPSDVYEVSVNDNQGSSINNPYPVEEDVIYAYVANGSAVWYSVMLANNRKLVINNPDAFVEYNGETYTANEDGVIEVALVEDGSYNICFGIGYASDAEDALEYADIECALVAPLGSRDNPIVLNDINELDTVTLEANEEGNEVWYVWTPYHAGRLFLLCDNVNNVITMNDGMSYTESIEGAPYVQLDIKPFVDVYISVAATATTEEMVTGTNPFTGEEFTEFMPVTNYVAAELDIDALVYARYKIEFIGLYSNGLAGETITVTDADDNIVATVVTDVAGVAEVLLPVGTYTFNATSPEAGYTVAPAIVDESSYVAYLSVAPYAFEGYYNEAIVMPGGTLEGYKLTIPAGETRYFSVRVNGTMNFTIIGNWDVAVQYGRQYVQPNRLGNIELQFNGNPMFGPVEFAIINNNTDADTTIIATLEPPAPGLVMDNPIVIEENDTYIASYDAETCIQGAVFYTYTATADGTIKITTSSEVASVVINNVTSGVYGDFFNADENTTAENPLVVSADVAEGDVVIIAIGVNDFEVYFADIEFAFECGADDTSAEDVTDPENDPENDPVEG